MINRVLQVGALASLLGLMVACSTQSPPLSKQIMIQGTWRAEFDGQPVTLEYNVGEITVHDLGLHLNYEWIDEDHIRLNAMGQQVVSRIEFETPDLMHQITDGEVQVLRRVRR